MIIGWLAAATPLHLEIGPCPGVDRSEVQRLVRIELDAELLDAPAPGAASASIRCEGTVASLRYRDAARTIELSDVDARARARLLALALAELAAPPPQPPPPPPPSPDTPPIPEAPPAHPPRAGANDPPPPRSPTDSPRAGANVPPPPRAGRAPSAPPPGPAVEPPPDPPRALPPPPEPEAPPGDPAATVTSTAATASAGSPTDLHFSAAVLGGLTLFTAEGPPAFGGRAAVEIAPSAFGARIDLGAYFGSEAAALGDVSLLLFAAGISAFGRFTGGIVLFDIGAGARAGFARIVGTPRDPSAVEGAAVSGAWAGPFLDARATFQLGPVLMVAALEGGLVIRPVVGVAQDAPVAAADGAWFAFHLGVGLEP